MTESEALRLAIILNLMIGSAFGCAAALLELRLRSMATRTGVAAGAAWITSAIMFNVIAWINAGWEGQTVTKAIAGTLLILPGVMVYTAPSILVALAAAWTTRALQRRIGK